MGSYSIVRLKTSLSSISIIRGGAVLFLMLTMAIISSSAQAKGNPRYASLVMDADTGVIIHERYADKKLHPASLTKAMTLLLAFDAIEDGRLRLSDRIKISRHAASMVPSKLDLPVGSSIRVKDAILSLVTKSANDVAAAMAEHIGGSERNFAKMMTARARQIGMKSTVFRNASGLHDKAQVTTARDMAKMARFIIDTYPGYYKYFSTRYFTYQGKTYRNHNRLMESYDGMDGMKTGYIAASGFNLIASAKRNNQRLIGVVFGGRSSRTRNAHMKKLLDNGFKEHRKMLVAQSRAPIPERKPVMAIALASLNGLSPTAGDEGDILQKSASAISSFNARLQNGMFRRLIGEGDYDPDISRRLETGLIAIAAHRGDDNPTQTALNKIAPHKSLRRASLSAASTQTMQSINDQWSVQIGAFTSRVQTDMAISKAQSTLPSSLRAASPIIVPTQNSNGWLFRARLNGYTKQQALAACQYLSPCIPIEPNQTLGGR